jgi:protocatechuate 4,5-dioxygenase alpha chain
MAHDSHIPGTMIFGGELAHRGLALNRMCFSLNRADHRAEFLADEEAYLDRYGLTDDQRRAVRRRDVPAMLAAGGNVYYLAKLAGLLGLGVQDLGGLQTGMSTEQFSEHLLDVGRRLRAGEAVPPCQPLTDPDAPDPVRTNAGGHD